MQKLSKTVNGYYILDSQGEHNKTLRDHNKECAVLVLPMSL